MEGIDIGGAAVIFLLAVWVFLNAFTPTIGGGRGGGDEGGYG